jgi:hypothetical protein
VGDRPDEADHHAAEKNANDTAEEDVDAQDADSDAQDAGSDAEDAVQEDAA